MDTFMKAMVSDQMVKSSSLMLPFAISIICPPTDLSFLILPCQKVILKIRRKKKKKETKMSYLKYLDSFLHSLGLLKSNSYAIIRV